MAAVEITHASRAPLRGVTAQLLLGIGGLALVTFVCFRLGFAVGGAGFFYVILLALVSLLGSFSASVVLSFLAAACLNYFFTEPLFEFRIDAPEDIESVAAFLTTSLVVTALTARLRADEARFRSVVDHAMDGFFLFDEHQAILEVNNQACQSLGYTRDEMIGMQPRDFDAGLDPASIARIGERVMAGETVTFETLHRRKDGSVFPVEVRARRFQHGAHKFRLSLARDITERIRAEEALRESEAKLQRAQAIAHFGWWERDFTTNLGSLSDEVCRIFGLQPADAGPHEGIWHARWLNLIHPEDRSRVTEAAKAALLPGGPRYDVEYRIVRPDGSERVIHSQGEVAWDHSGRALRQFGVLHDITERKEAEQRLVVEHAVAQILAEAASVGEAAPKILQTICEHLGWDLATLWRIDDEAGVLRCALLWRKQSLKADQFEAATQASTFARGLGLPGRVWTSGVAACIPDVTEDPTFLRGSIAAQEGLHAAFAFPILLSGEVVAVIDLVSRNVRHAEPSLLGMMTALGSQIGQFIERKRVEAALRGSEERFRTLIQFSFDVYWESDAQHRFTRQEFAEGLSDAPAVGSEIGKTRWEVPYLEPDAESWQKHRETLDAHLPFRDFELARPAPDGGKRYVSVSGLPVFDRSGTFLGYRGVGRHITNRKRTEEALRRNQAYLTEAQRLSQTGTIVFNAKGPVYWSEESYRIWNFDPRQGLPELDNVLQRIHPDDRDTVNKQAFEALHRNRKYAIDFRIVLPDGTIKDVESTGYPLLSSDGEPEMIVTHRDVTERKRAQAEHEKLRQLEADLAHINRLSIMGELTASLAHEILHPIATARNNARSALRFLDMDPADLGEVREALECVVRDTDRGRDIVSRIREQIKKAPPRKEPFDINAAIREVIVMVQSAIEKNNVSVSSQLVEDLGLVHGDRVQLQQVLLNLILNAVEAMSSIKGPRKLSIRTEQNKTGDILVAVRDTGPGIDPERITRVFEPFYTTKTTGVGMGLSICRSIIGAHGGRLWAEPNQTSRGAVFQFTLPAPQEGS
jgi:PAS domain S-box-containing protein